MMRHPIKLIPNQLKVQAFTLVEITIALVLSFFILGILYLSYNMMGRQFQSEYEKQLSSLVLLKSEMDLDFFYADSITSNGTDQINIFSNGKVSSYQFTPQAILGERNLFTDSLYIGECQTELVTAGKNNHVRQLTFRLKVDQDEIQLSFCKFFRPNQKLNDKEISFEY